MKYLLSFFILSSLGCASYQAKIEASKNDLRSKKCDSALLNLEKLSQNESSDQLAYLMEYGSALQICQQYEKSNAIFSQAENLADKIDYTSISQIAGATLFNEEFISYKGDSFEKLFLNASKALNYLDLYKYDDALVEVRRMNQKFDKYKNEGKKNYELNSFSKYLSGLIWEATGRYDDACIDYKDAFSSTISLTTNQSNTKMSRGIGYQMLKTCWQANRYDEFKMLTKSVKLSDEEIQNIKNEKLKSELVVLFLKGWGPQKIESPQNPGFPYLVKSTNYTQYLKIQIKDSNNTVVGSFTSEPIYSVSDAAFLSLEADQAPLIARRLAARVAKQIVADQIGQKNAALGVASLIVMVGSERADLRQWAFLPDAIHTIRVTLKPGNYTASVTGLDYAQQTSDLFSDFNFTIQKNQKVIKSFRSLH